MSDPEIGHPNRPHDPYAALRQRDFRLLFAGRLLTSMGGQMLGFAIGWELWLRTNNAFILGLVGLVQVIPIIILSLPAGHLADHYNRRKIVEVTQFCFAIFSFGLAALSYFEGPIWAIFVCLFGIGVARAFSETASSTLLPEVVPPHLFTSAATWSSSSWQLASIAGPTLAGLMVAWLNSVTPIYVIDALAALLFVLFLTQIKSKPLPLSGHSETMASLLEGVRFIYNSKIILAAITLDMFAVIFGGAVALLPVYATDILKVGPVGLGILRAAPSIGAIVVAFLLAHLPPFKRAGRVLLWAVVGFGLATIVFGFSTHFWLSLLMLFILGGLDNISVVIRSTLMLTYVPDEMRGRAAAVNGIFIGGSNELGQFESGLAAALFGPMMAVVLGGIGTLIVVAWVANTWPQLRNMGSLDAHRPAEL